jgi:hypothetical protein
VKALGLKERITSAFINLSAKVGFAFIGLWSRKHKVLPLLLAISIVSWLAASILPHALMLNLAVLVTSILFVVLLMGVAVIADIEGGLTPLEKVPKVVVGALVGVVVAYPTLLLYLNGVLISSLPPLQIMTILLAPGYALEIALLVTLAVVVPPTVGYFLLKPMWFDVRKRYPFWGAYLGILSALLLAYPIVRDPSQLTMRAPLLVTSGATIVASLALIVRPRGATIKAAGLALMLLGLLSSMACFHYTMLGSMLAIIGGAFAYSWKSRGQ